MCGYTTFEEEPNNVLDYEYYEDSMTIEDIMNNFQFEDLTKKKSDKKKDYYSPIPLSIEENFFEKGAKPSKKVMTLNRFEKEGNYKTWNYILQNSIFAGIVGAYFSHGLFDAPVIGGIVSIIITAAITFLASKSRPKESDI